MGEIINYIAGGKKKFQCYLESRVAERAMGGKTELQTNKTNVESMKNNYESVEMPQSAHTYNRITNHLIVAEKEFRIRSRSVCVWCYCQEINLLLLVWIIKAEKLRFYRKNVNIHQKKKKKQKKERTKREILNVVVRVCYVLIFVCILKFVRA